MNRATLIAIAITIGGCGSTGAPAVPAGTAPVVSDLKLATTTLTVGKTETLTGTLKFVDPDKDAKTLKGEITLSSGQKQALPGSDAQGVNGAGEGTVILGFMFNLPTAGSYTLALWMADAAGNESNHLTATLTAQ